MYVLERTINSEDMPQGILHKDMPDGILFLVMPV